MVSCQDDFRRNMTIIVEIGKPGHNKRITSIMAGISNHSNVFLQVAGFYFQQIHRYNIHIWQHQYQT